MGFGAFLFLAIIFIGFLVVVGVVAVVVVFLKLCNGILTGDLNSGYLVALAGLLVVDDHERLGKAVEPKKLPFDFLIFSAGSSQNDTVSDISGGSKLLWLSMLPLKGGVVRGEVKVFGVGAAWSTRSKPAVVEGNWGTLRTLKCFSSIFDPLLCGWKILSTLELLNSFLFFFL